MRACCVPGAILSSGEMALYQTDKLPTLIVATFVGGREIVNEDINKIISGRGKHDKANIR